MNGASQQKQHSYASNILNIEPLRGSVSFLFFFHRVSPGAIHMKALRALRKNKTGSLAETKRKSLCQKWGRG
jgi:hypothetical protein